MNASNQKNVEGQAQVIIGRILNEQSAKAMFAKQIESFQAELNKLSQDVVSQQSVLGTTLGNNPNEVTIAKAIAKMNEDRQKSVETQATSLTSCIVNKQAEVTAADKRIAELRKQLSELTVPIVDAAAVTRQSVTA